ncbi:hypothetical protein ACS0TY_011759 [Phlomoides rotata]
MEKGKRIEAEHILGFLLPEVIIQHIQSFLCAKGAARTTILSKSWHRSWLTRPNLDFDQYGVVVRKFNDLDAENKFWNHVKETVQSYSLANESIMKAMKMGAIDLDFQIFKPDTEFVFPHEVLESENLTRLAVSWCRIELGADGKIRCSRLKSLSLCDVRLESHVIWDIILSCPLIEKLSLCRCTFLLKTQSSNVPSGTRTSEVALSPEFAKRKSINTYEICKLKYLLLGGIEVHTSFFHDFSTKFPCLKELSVHHCDGFKGIQISGPSLECINFTHYHQMLRVKFDVPNIRKFTFSGSHSPSLSFKTDRSNWESDIYIMCCRRPTAAWFLNLNKFLTKLKCIMSKISLTLQILPMTTFAHVGNLQGLPKPLVDNLKISVPSSDCPVPFDIIFCCCRPIFLPQSWLPEWSRGAKSNNDFVEIVYKRLMQQVSHQSMPAPHDLMEVSVELFDEAVSVWRPVPWESLLNSSTRVLQPLPEESSRDASTSQEAEQIIQLLPWESLQDASVSAYPEAEKRIRFHLRWGIHMI